MASSGVETGAFSGRTSFRVRVAVVLHTVDAANNRARWAIGIRIDNTSGSSATWSGGSGNWAVSVDGVTVDSGTASPFDFRDGAAFHDIASNRLSGWVAYDANGGRRLAFAGSVSSSTIFGSASASGSVAADVIPHPAPSGLAVSRVSDSTQRLSWRLNGVGTSVRVFRSVDGGPWVNPLATLAAGATSYDDTTTSAGHTYRYAVAQVAANAVSDWSNHATIGVPPATPTGLTATRVSDARVDLSWAKASTTTSAVVQRQTDGGAWQQVGAPSGNVTSFSDLTTSAGHKYAYRVLSVSAGGQSGWSNLATVYTSPAAPTGISASRSGMDIVVKASSVPPFVTGFDVMDGASVVASGVSLPWTHVAPNVSVQHTYKVRGVAPGAVAGAWSSPSNTVQLIAPPNAPVGLAPNGAIRASDGPVRLSWTHNPVDSSAQSAYELQWRLTGGAWTTLTGTTAAFRDVTLPLGDVQWQVRTKGTDPGFSPWSAVAVVTVITRPGVAITQPSVEWEASVLTVGWSWFQPQSRPQSAWKVELLDAAGKVVEARSGSGAGTTFTATTRLSPGDWTVRVMAATGDVWSLWGTQSFTVVFDPPAPPVITGEWSEDTGVVTLTVAAGGAEGPADIDDLTMGDRMVLWDAFPVDTDVQVVAPLLPAAVRLMVERLTGTEWVTVLDGPAGVTFTDAESPSYADIVYRATAFTVEGATTATEIIVPARSGAVWLSGGPGFMTVCRLPMTPDVQPSAGRARVLKAYAGRSRPVAYAGEGTSKAWSVTTTVTDRTFIEPTASPDELLELAQSPEPVFQFRDPDGRVLVGVLGDMSLRRQMASSSDDMLRPWNAFWGCSFTITEADGV